MIAIKRLIDTGEWESLRDIPIPEEHIWAFIRYRKGLQKYFEVKQGKIRNLTDRE